MMCIAYNRETLLNIRNQCMDKKVDRCVWNELRDMNIAKTTHRGCSAGKYKQRQIRPIISQRLPPNNQNSGFRHAGNKCTSTTSASHVNRDHLINVRKN